MPATAGNSRREVCIDCLGNRSRRPVPPGFRRQRLEIAAVRDIAELDQDRRHVGRLEHPEAGGPQRVLVHARGVAHLGHQRRARTAPRRSWFRAAPGRTGCRRRRRARPKGRAPRSRPTRSRFRRAAPRRRPRPVRQGVDGRALGIAVAARQRIGMDRHEQPGLPLARDAPRARQAARRCRRCGSSTTRYLPVFSIWSRNSSENSSTIDFSSSPLAARVPLSMPPWPGSSTISGRGSAFSSGVAATGGGRL